VPGSGDETLKFEEAMEQLTHIVAELEKGELTLEQALEFFQRGIGLLRFLVGRLDSFEEQIEVLLDEFYSEAPDWLDKPEAGGRIK
jgi:exodeoxyribonuclease VII small subunit